MDVHCTAAASQFLRGAANAERRRFVFTQYINDFDPKLVAFVAWHLRHDIAKNRESSQEA
jgi:hypothetical protein